MGTRALGLSRLGAGLASKFARARRLLLAYDPETLEAPIAARLRTAQFEAATRHARLMLLGNLVNAFVIVVVAAGGRHFAAALAWAAVLGLLLIPMAKKPRAKDGSPGSGLVPQRTLRRLVRNTAVLAAIWGTAPALLMGGDPGQQLIAATVSVGMLSGGAFGLATLPMAAIAYVLPLGGGFLLSMLLTHAPVHFMGGPLMLAYMAVLSCAAISHANSFADSVIAQARAELAARHDPLTGLANRAAFDAALSDAFVRLERYGERFFLLFIDLDDFKLVNDRLGHQAGDELLRQAAFRLRDAVEAGDVIARIGGDEFAVLSSFSTGAQSANTLAADIASRFEVAFTLEAGSPHSRASVGVALAPENGGDPKRLIAHADQELYRAKRAGDGNASSARVGAMDHRRRRRALIGDMRASLSRGDFFLQYQPVQTLRGGRFEAFEALARWRHPTLGLIPPLEFIEIAEGDGLIHELGEWILNEALKTAADWPEDVRVAVNVSGEQLRDPAFDGVFERAIAASGVDPKRVRIEVTESASLAAVEQGALTLRRLYARGAEIALDNFGVGYSSIARISRLPVKRLKIDRAFVAELPLGRESAAIVEATIGIARALDFAVTAGGVETEAQRAYLALAGVGEVQGRLIGRPLDAAEALTWLGRQAAPLADATAA